MTAMTWWQEAVIYQVYPRSFQDSNGDGVGDLPGITQRLEYLAGLGVDAIWISPIYPSPMADFGYDVADYCGIDPIFGTLEDFDRLVARAHDLGLRVILDFVPNHTSDQHPWFRESRAARDSAKRDWYLWRDPAPGGGPPNNWLSRFGGSAWQWDEATGQYYYHAFLPQQPDLNWRHPAVRQAMDQVLRFWLDRGVDGFRVDVVWLLCKDVDFRDNPLNPAFAEGQPDHHRQLQRYTEDHPETLDVVRAMRATLDEYGHRVLIGEIYLPVERLVAYYGQNSDAAHLPFNFQLLTSRWEAGELARIVNEYEAALPHKAWPNWVLGNHDNPRLATRVGAAQARVAAMLLLTLRGTPTLYYGDELGMRDAAIPPEAVHDPAELRQPGIGQGRDPERTPMHWDDSPGAGFTSGRPWLPLGEDLAQCNVAAADLAPRSLLMLYRRLIALRRAMPALVAGDVDAVQAVGGVLSYYRRHEGVSCWIILNVGGQIVHVDGKPGRVALSTGLDREGERVDHGFTLRGDEGLIVVLD